MGAEMTEDKPGADLAEVVSYRPISPAALLSLVAGLAALLSAALVGDLGRTTFLTVAAVGVLAGFRGLASIRRYDMGGRAVAKVGVALSVVAVAAGFGVDAYRAAYEVPEGYQKITYDLLQPNIGERVPATAKELDGKRVFIKGYMYPGDRTAAIKEFTLCRDNGTCCFGGQPKLADMIEVTLQGPLTLDYASGLRHLAGTFHLVPEDASAAAGGGPLGGVLYRLDADYAR